MISNKPSNVKELLNKARKELLDLSLRNPMLNFKMPKARGVEIVEAISTDIFNILVVENKSLRFLPCEEKSIENNDVSNTSKNIEQPSINTSNENDKLDKLKLDKPPNKRELKTSHVEKALQARLLKTYYDARTFIEERGSNILFLALGMLYWYEDDNSDKTLKAPILLIPVKLTRNNANDGFSIEYTQDDIDKNLSLYTKLKSDFSIILPDLAELEQFEIISYFQEIEGVIKKRSKWCIKQNEIALGFFSFGKLFMYRDLDPETWEQANKKIHEHKIINSILATGFDESELNIQENESLDQYLLPKEINHVVDADSSQILAIMNVKAGRNLIIQGPPGTGKSQTITNIIAEALGENKAVLFVAEKVAALDVVKRRLDTLHLGDACLALHSNNINKKSVIKELQKTYELGKPYFNNAAFDENIFLQLRNQLNDYSQAINTQIQPTNYTPYQTIGELIKIKKLLGETVLPKVTPPSDILNWHKSEFKQLSILVENLQKHLEIMGVPSEHPYLFSQLTLAMPSDKEKIKESLSTSIKAINLIENITIELSNFLFLNLNNIDKRKTITLIELAKDLLKSPFDKLQELNVKSKEWVNRQTELKELFVTGVKFNANHSKYDAILLPMAWETDFFQVRQVFNTTGRKWWRFLSGEYRRAKKYISGFFKQEIPKDINSLITIIDAINETKSQKNLIQQYAELGKNLFGNYWLNEKSDWSLLESLTQWINSLYKDIKEDKTEIINFFATNPSAKDLETKLALIENYFTNYQTQLPILFSFLEINKETQEQIIEKHFDKQKSIITNMLDSFERLSEQITYNQIRKDLVKHKLDWVVDLACNWELADQYLLLYFQQTWFEAILKKAFEERKALAKFNASSHEEIIKKFCELDKEMLKFNRYKLMNSHWAKLPSRNKSGQVGILLKEFERKKGHLPIRKLISSAGDVVKTLKPVFMMSPLSIASFIAPGAIDFDLVIFDEASQVKPVDAFGAIARGQQVVVVGDSKQMPPTSFFDKLAEDPNDDEENATTDMESILGLMASQGALQKMLRWHYRSKHESLIAVSNKEMYENKLFIFPNPDIDRRDLGLFLNHLPNTIYGKDASRTNLLEAESVAKAVIKHAKTKPQSSLGVVAFSLSQRQAILDSLEILRKENPECESFFSDINNEPFFVKNLESVQGDERDTIFISIGYGRNAEGKVSMNFGAVNTNGGERRLNVLISRARSRCEVFSNITYEDIDLSRTQSRGVAILKTFLKYAQTGLMDIADSGQDEAESVFEEQVANTLKQYGQQVKNQVGSAGYRLDLAVVDPQKPGRYLLGIECDGAKYHSSQSARDRDRLRQYILEQLGWKIHRVWSTDWFLNPEKELKKILSAIEKAKIELEPQSTILEENEANPTNIIIRKEEIKVSNNELIAEYELAKLKIDLSEPEQKDFYKIPYWKLTQCIVDIVSVESPIHQQEAIRRLTNALGIKRVGERIESTITDAITKAEKLKKIYKIDQFLWFAEMKEPILRNRANLEGVPNLKKIEYISSEEIIIAIKQVIKDTMGIKEDALAIEVSRLFGFSKTTDDIREVIMTLINKLSDLEEINYSNGFLKLNKS